MPNKRAPIGPEGLGRAIRVLRAERGISRGDVAEQAGLSYTHLAEIENEKKRPSSQALARIAEVLGVRPFELMALADALASGETSIASNVVYRLGETTPAAAMRMDAPSQSPANRSMPARRRTSEEPRLAQLLEFAKELPPEDLEVLVNLAGRLARDKRPNR